MNTQNIPEVNIFSDGGANPNPGPGAYGVILEFQGIKKELSQGFIRTTNNRMELRGVITGLQNLKTRSKVTIFTDSQYTINGIQKGWAKKWKHNNWYRTKSQKATNSDLWEILLELVQKHEVHFYWIKGHNGHLENERCDELATIAMKRKDLIADSGFIEKEKPLSHTSLGEKKGKAEITSSGEKVGKTCKKCQGELEKKIPKHTKKTLLKKYFYEYYHHCPQCKTNYMLEEAKRDISTLQI